MESIEACEQVPWSPGQNSCSRLVVMQRTNNVQSSDGLMDGVSEQDSKVTLFWAYTNMARVLVIRLARTRAPAYQQAMHGIWNNMEQATGKAGDAQRRGALR
jgi:hypothetical protein